MAVLLSFSRIGNSSLISEKYDSLKIKNAIGGQARNGLEIFDNYADIRV